MESLVTHNQYNDFFGEAAGDNGDQTTIQDLAKKHGVNDYVVGARIYSGENGYLSISVFTVDTNDFNEIQNRGKANNGILEVERHELKVTLDEFLGAFKRFDVAIRNERYTEVKEMKYETEEP